MTPRRLKSTIILAGLIVSGLTIVAWTGDWFTLRLDANDGVVASVTVSGEIAAGGLAALGLAGLALVGALSIAGAVFRVILALLEVFIGGTVVLSAVTALADPVSAGAAAVTSATGIAGSDSIAGLVVASEASGWPGIALALGVATAGIGVTILITHRRWPRSSRRYQALRLEDPAAPDAPRPGGEPTPTVDPDNATRWDALSDGSDPTSR